MHRLAWRRGPQLDIAGASSTPSRPGPDAERLTRSVRAHRRQLRQARDHYVRSATLEHDRLVADPQLERFAGLEQIPLAAVLEPDPQLAIANAQREVQHP